MAKNRAKDFFIARCEPHRCQFFGAAKARPPGEHHASILPYAPCNGDGGPCQTESIGYDEFKVREFSNDGRPPALSEPPISFFYGSTCQPVSPTRW